MTPKDTERLRRLINRRDHLRVRIARRQADHLNADFDQAEESALTWAIAFLEGALSTEQEERRTRHD